MAKLLVSRKIDAVTARDCNMLGKSDEEHLKYSITLKRVLLTHNRNDFEKLYTHYLENNIFHYGIISMTRKRDVYTTAHRIVQLFSKNADVSNQLWYV
ncbi:MAG: DUF5615 family PIN-like protein [Ignavibacteriae bacterium]|nr:DUF5615 family PIN-like protein [Ignavibacteriota bacterium]